MSNTATAPTPTVRILGITEDVNECSHCGRTGLRRTVEIDIDGQIDNYGTSCAANVYPKLGSGRDIAARAAKLCDCGCGNFATMIYNSGRKLFAGCVTK
jgi:hypothetical protein